MVIQKVSFGEKLSGWFLIASLIAAFVGVVFIFYWAFRPYDVLQIKNTNGIIHLEPTEVDGQHYVVGELSFCKTIPAHGEVELKMISDKTELAIPWPDDTSNDIGCHNKTLIPLPVPPQAATDTYYYQFTITYHPNPLRTTTEIIKTSKITVINHNLSPDSSIPKN